MIMIYITPINEVINYESIFMLEGRSEFGEKALLFRKLWALVNRRNDIKSPFLSSQYSNWLEYQTETKIIRWMSVWEWYIQMVSKYHLREWALIIEEKL